MRLHLRRPTQAIPTAYARQPVPQGRMDVFRQALTHLFARLDENESEAYQKTIVANFLAEAFRTNQPNEALPQIAPFEIDTDQAIDLLLRRKASGQDQATHPPASAVLEVRKVYAGEMITTLKNNVRALHELILYYFNQVERHPENPINQLIITDVYNWFLFSEQDFRQFFYANAKLKKLYLIKQQQQKDDLFFFNETARILRELDEEIPVTYLNLREAADALTLNPAEGNRMLVSIFKLLSPEQLFSLPITMGTPTLNQGFYTELLYILGLHETTVNRRLIRQRLPEGERQEGSLLEMTINTLQADSGLLDSKITGQYGADETEQIVSISLSLCLIWLNRILFLKLLEGQLSHYYRAAPDQAIGSVRFLTARQIRDFDELGELFFEVLAVPEKQRSARVVSRYGPVPYLNSSLFEPTELERQTVSIKKLSNLGTLPSFEKTILTGAQPVGLTHQDSLPLPAALPTLDYLLTFLDAYKFAPDSPAGVQTDDKPLVNAASIGLLFEKLNDHRTSTVTPPDFSIAYMTREAIRQTVVTHFNDRYAWTCTSTATLHDRLGEISLAEANAVINSLRIVDPAVGSGCILVSALNELLVLKAELGILTDREGRPLRHYDIRLINAELVVTDEQGELIDYYAPDAGNALPHAPGPTPHATPQHLQETLFREKQTLVENCLFGVDRNPSAVHSCQVRLWIELLKSSYFTMSASGAQVLCALPNLDLNIKAGDSLVSQFGLGFRPDSARNTRVREKFLPIFQRYRRDVLAYKRCHDKVEKERIRIRLLKFQEFIQQIVPVDQKALADIRQLEDRLAQSAQTFDFVNQQDHLQQLNERLIARKALYDEKQRVFRQVFEWRFTFPEILDETGTYQGFDLVLSKPPHSRQQVGIAYRNYLKKAFPNTYTSPADRYGLFIEQGLNLLNLNGRLVYLLPDKWLTVAQSRKLRSWLKTKAIEQITRVSRLPGFDKSTTCPLILSLRKEDANPAFRVAQIQPLQSEKTEVMTYQYEQIGEVPMNSLPDDGWVLFDGLAPI